jgi:PTH1 family peptidyl-tRNA hydrolase
VSELKLIVGLGNPGKEYETSRHNLGLRIVSCLAKEYKLRFKKSWIFSSLLASSRIEKEAVILCLPLTFMNNSGKAVRKILFKKKIEPKNLLVVLDDVNLLFGTLRIRAGGNDGGHNGLKSTIDFLKTEQFCRLRLGIDSSSKSSDLRDFVLSPFSSKEEKELRGVIKKAKACIVNWLKEGVVKTMNKFN